MPISEAITGKGEWDGYAWHRPTVTHSLELEPPLLSTLPLGARQIQDVFLSRERGGEDCEVSNQERPPPVAPVIMTICQTWKLRLKQVKYNAHGTCSLPVKESSLLVKSLGSRFRDHFTTFNCKVILHRELRVYVLADRVKKAKEMNSVVHFMIKRHHIILHGEEHFSQ